ncbi:MAG: hypothetical protein N0C81_20365 [Candidatus Thiodiazotropha lotti]|nr:hypothetical protein [Candidatus Thiodiazotropha lotti]MCG7923602.1 hypothetical protein [Candidatus Thiodiazotropha lotti]MCG7987218.1 hypothetical protein [Candidatus Thiodiazotropha lotti]MCG8005634.1 hypothetical protein [Candidatus Thiodiazotropha lotti]MCG8009984.1 hypothetical protein [Candidatus Thiodiazotropha lotti]
MVNRVIFRNIESNWADEDIVGPVYVSIRWRSRPYLINDVKAIAGGGVYLLLNGQGTILKAGQTQSFRERVKTYASTRNQSKPARDKPHKMYLGEVLMQRSPTDLRAPLNTARVMNSVEQAIIRTLRRAGLRLKMETNYRGQLNVVGEIHIRNILPTPYTHLVRRAYGYRLNRNRYEPVPIRIRKSSRALYLRQADHPLWADELDEIVNSVA